MIFFILTNDHPTSFKVEQSMVWESGPMKAQAKGLKAVCNERFGPEAIAGLKHYQLIELLEKEPDFKWERKRKSERDARVCTHTHTEGQMLPILFKRTSNTIIEDEAAKRGDIIIFTAKFNAELAPIESAYREVAKVLREQNVVGTSRGAIFFSNLMMKKKEIRILEKKTDRNFAQK